MRLLAHYAQDEQMINAYKEGRDLYATMAARIHNNDYWDNMEHFQDGTPNPEGKKRRSNVKSICLGKHKHTIAQVKTCEHYYSVV